VDQRSEADTTRGANVAGRPYAFLLAVAALVLISITFVVTILSVPLSPEQIAMTWSSIVGVFGTVIGAYFGIKISSDTIDKTQRAMSSTTEPAAREPQRPDARVPQGQYPRGAREPGAGEPRRSVAGEPQGPYPEGSRGPSPGGPGNSDAGGPQAVYPKGTQGPYPKGPQGQYPGESQSPDAGGPEQPTPRSA
jgi:hypothetical protein